MAEAGAVTAVTSAERAYAHVKQAILDGRHASGERLPEERIADDLGVSRTPVRDALRRLEAEGLVAIAPNSGARVASWDADELGEITTMRVMLEGYAAELASTRIGSDALTDLAANCDAMQAALDDRVRDTVDRIGALNLAFHRTIASAAGNRRLLAAIEPLWHLPIVIRKYSLFSPDRIEQSLRHHREILAALEARDGEWAGSVMRSHIRSARTFDRLLISAGDDDV